MKSKIINLLMFTAGAAISSVVTWKLVKTKYEQMADAEIESMKRFYEAKEKGMKTFELKKFEPKKFEPVPLIDPFKEERAEYSNIIKDSGYSNEEGGPVDVGVKPYVISPDEFGELEHYRTVTLYYHSDGILADEDHEMIEDIDECVGVESLKHFGEYEDDSVFVRNDRQRIDYEILMDESKFDPESPAIGED